MKAHPAPVYKIKMRRTEDIDLLRVLRANTGKPFRIDANEAFNFEEIKKNVART